MKASCFEPCQSLSLNSRQCLLTEKVQRWIHQDESGNAFLLSFCLISSFSNFVPNDPFLPSLRLPLSSRTKTNLLASPPFPHIISSDVNIPVNRQHQLQVCCSKASWMRPWPGCRTGKAESFVQIEWNFPPGPGINWTTKVCAVRPYPCTRVHWKGKVFPPCI